MALGHDQYQMMGGSLRRSLSFRSHHVTSRTVGNRCACLEEFITRDEMPHLYQN